MVYLNCATIYKLGFDKIIPLKKLVFRKELLSNIQAVTGTITEDFCGIKPVTLRPGKKSGSIEVQQYLYSTQKLDDLYM